MPQHGPDTPPASWPARPGAAPRHGAASTRPARILATIFASVLALTLLAAWAVPPLLDWGRFRTGIAAIAAAQLGRQVSIGGEVSFRLLPEAVLTATDVSLPDQGDGISAQLGALRLQVAVMPLLAGRIVPRDLVLGTPVLHLPWPLPDGLTHPSRPHVPHAFAAHIESGTLRIGQAQVTGINALVHGGPEPISVAGVVQPNAASGFGAEGFAAFGDRRWRFTSALGAPDADGVSALDLAVSGQGMAAGTNGSLQGTLAEGVVQGRLRAGGPDLSLLMPADSLAWTAEAPFVASADRIEASAIGLSLGGSPAEASLVFHLGASARLDGRVHAASLDLDNWLRIWGASLAAGQPRRPVWTRLPGRLDYTADVATLLNGTLTGLRGALVSDGTSLSLDQVAATLPGQARIEVSGTIIGGPAGLRVRGPGRFDAPDLHATLAWLRPLAPALFDAAPPAALRRATVSGTVAAGAGMLSVSGLTGTVDGAAVAGGFGVGLRPRPSVGMGLQLERPVLENWLGPGWPASLGVLAGVGRTASGVDADVHLRAASCLWHGVVLEDAALDMRTGPAGLAVTQAKATVSGLRVSVAGGIAPDGSVSDGTLSATTSETAPLLGLLPPAWRWAPGLWHGPASLEAILSGSPSALAGQLRADAGDLVMEADWRGDAIGRSGAGTVTLRHPGAPRLLAALGVGGAQQWLDTGSLALRAQMGLRAGHLAVDDFDLTAADIRLGGRLDVDMSGPQPFVRGAIDAETLALPGLKQAEALPLLGMRGWAAQLHLTAGQVTFGRMPGASGVKAKLDLAEGDALLDVISAQVSGGRLSGQVAFDAGPLAALAVRGGMQGVHVAGGGTSLPVDLAAGDLDAAVDVAGAGGNLAALVGGLAGHMQLTLRDGDLTGFDLAQAGRNAAQGRPGRAALASALSRGRSSGLSGTAGLDVAAGRLLLAPTRLTSADGDVAVRGTADLARGIDLSFSLMPAGGQTTGLGVHAFGMWGDVHATPQYGTIAVPRPHRARRR